MVTNALSGDDEQAVPASGGQRPAEPRVTIVVCSSCRYPDDPPETFPRPGSALVAATRHAARNSAIAVKQVACLGNCKRGLSAAVLRTGSWSYVFGGLDTQSAVDLVAGAELFSRSTDGFMPFSDRPEALRRGLIARIPTTPNLQDLK